MATSSWRWSRSVSSRWACIRSRWRGGAACWAALSEPLTFPLVCHSADERPLVPSVGGGAADHGDLVLTSADGTRFASYFARAAHPTGSGMVVVPDAGGISQFYTALARRF